MAADWITLRLDQYGYVDFDLKSPSAAVGWLTSIENMLAKLGLRNNTKPLENGGKCIYTTRSDELITLYLICPSRSLLSNPLTAIAANEALPMIEKQL